MYGRGEAFSETHSFPPLFKRNIWLYDWRPHHSQGVKRREKMGTPAQQYTGNEAEFRHKTFLTFFFGSRDGSQFFFAKPLSHKLPQLAAAATQYDTWNPSLPPHHHQEAYFRSPASPYKNPLFGYNFPGSYRLTSSPPAVGQVFCSRGSGDFEENFVRQTHDFFPPFLALYPPSLFKR